MTVIEYADSLKHGLFASRENLDEALRYVEKLASASDNPVAVITAVQVVLNTISNELKEIASAK
jgi:pyrroloquinoline quinone (PQQ) biosynthesis protein C